MPSYKLKYFSGRGFAEVPRLLFALAGQDYEDVRFTQETWPAEKPKTRFGQMPILEVDGKTFSQSSAISRYLARKFGFYGSNDEEACEVDQVYGIMQDVINVMMKLFFEKDEAKKAELRKEAVETKMPQYMNMLEKILKENGTGFFVGNKISLADVLVFDFADKIKDLVNFDNFPEVKKSIEMVKTNPKIKAWIEKRPVTEF